MIKNYFITTFRHLWRNKLFTALNILGLAIGISACWVVYRVVDYEFSFENKLPDKENTYRLITGRIFDERESAYGGVSAPIYQGIREQVTGVGRVVPVFRQHRFLTVRIPQETGNAVLVEEPQEIVSTDSSYFGMVHYTWLAGNKVTAFHDPQNVVLTASRAKSYFPNLKPEEIQGRTLIYNDTIQKTISGIVKDLDYPTEFTAQEFIYLEPRVYSLNEWTNTNGGDRVYLQISASGDTAKVKAQITAMTDQKWKEFQQEQKPTYSFVRWFSLMPLADSHFATQLNEHGVRKASKSVLFGLMGIGGFLLLLACINYINLSTAQMPQRNKEIGVRKTLGSSRSHLVGQILSETLVTVLLAAFLSFILSKLAFVLLGDIIPEGTIEHVRNTGFIFFMSTLLLLVTLFAGCYPAWLVTRVSPVRILRGQTFLSAGNRGLTLRKGLIVFQFVIAQCFIIGALIMGQQLNYTIQKDLGFDKEAVLLIDVPWRLSVGEANRNKEQVLVNELRKESGIRMVSQGKAPMIQGFSSSPYTYASAQAAYPTVRQLHKKLVDTNYLRFYDMELLAGRNLRATDTISELIINETAAKIYGFANPQHALGKILSQGDRPYPVVGVVRDFHSQDFYTAIEPLALMTASSDMGTINVKLSADPASWQRTIEHIQQHWNSIYPPDAFNCRFYDENIESLYQQERNTAKLIDLATTVAIVISCLGLFGLATFTAFQRTKEIGIRKVLGATVSGIVALLSKDFLRLVLVAIVIASPIAWWAMNKWLEDFAYRIDIQWWMFTVAGLAAVVIALLTVSFQAIKAAVANPVDSLRDE
ncbi:ABC transporter permease [Parapedobacter tibetensis]|uniref:ABC transporter permease n=1 Tax=Parapedobacter tibetensis TaxID=2972951 RepID=UPI00214D9892|nr:ABC transporter permease [Parapedobacter tibetensis]